MLLSEILQTQGPETIQSVMVVLQQKGDISTAFKTDVNDLDICFLPSRTDIFRFNFDVFDEASSTETYVDGDVDAPMFGRHLPLSINGIVTP